jgi:hypothetical protein
MEKVFKVICIKSFRAKQEANKNLPEPAIGDIDEVMFERVVDGLLYYSLVRFGAENGYAARNFATLPGITEEIEAEHEHEAIIYQR